MRQINSLLQKNASKIGGVDMFIFQAIESLKIWEEDVIDMDIDINKIKGIKIKTMLKRLQFLTAGESHGKGLLGILDGILLG